MKKLYLMTLLCIAAVTASAEDMYYIDMQCPEPPATVGVNAPFSATFKVLNFDPQGSGDVNSFDIIFAPEGGSAVTRHVELDAPLTNTTVTVDVAGFTCDVLGVDIPATFTLANVNGGAREVYTEPVNFKLTSVQTLYERGVVFEECTGSWCHFCYDAYLAMEYMYETYGHGGGFLGFAVHDRDSYSTEYSGIVSSHASGYPNGFWDRQYSRQITPTKTGLENTFLRKRAESSTIGLDVNFELPAEGNTLDLRTTVSFGTDFKNRKFKISYMLTENGLVGQQNSQYGYLAVQYNDVARNGSVYNPVPVNEIPDEVMAGDTYDVAGQVDLSYITDRNKACISVLLTDAETGEVVNATRQPLVGRWTGSGEIVTDVIATATVSATEYYDLSGRRIPEPSAPGIYVKRAGGKSTKFIIR